MKIFPSLTFSILTTLFARAAADDAGAAAVGTAEFEKHRPVYHFLARKNWMNDPCGPYFDEATELYHMFYQFNPNSTVWGNMTWGHAVSSDQVTWQDYPDALQPLEDEYDYLGVFSGFAMKNAIEGKQTLFYTGVTALPISWTLEYLFGEHVNYATTDDNGKTWQKGAKPLIAEPPQGLNVTGWRDPMPFHSKSLDAHFGYNPDKKASHYLITAGGIHDIGSRIFLYHSTDYTDWEYKGFLLSKEKNTTFSEYSGNWGFNFETTIYLELDDEEGESHNLMFFAAEGTPRRYPMWTTGTIGGPKGKICADAGNADPDVDSNNGFFQPLMVGITDRSDWYANSIYKDAVTGKDILVGWITEDNGFSDVQPQGWNGILSLQREVSITIVRDIYDADKHYTGQGDWIVSSTDNVTCGDETVDVKTIKTLGLKPLENLQLLRGDGYESIATVTVTNASDVVLDSTDKSFELKATITNFERGSQVGFKIRSSSEGDEFTSVYYDDATKQVVVDRSSSSSADCSPFTTENFPDNSAVWGYFYLNDLVNKADDQCSIVREPLSFHVFVDVSVVEVFVNDRFTLSARFYPCEGKTNSDGIALTTSGESSTFENIEVWTNPKHAWTEERVVPEF